MKSAPRICLKFCKKTKIHKPGTKSAFTWQRRISNPQPISLYTNTRPFSQTGRNDWVLVYELTGCGFVTRWCHLNFRYRAWSSKEFLDNQATIECGFSLKRVCDMIITYSQMHRTDNSQHSSIIWVVWLKGWVFVYELSGCGFKSRCCHLNFRYGAFFEQVLSHWGNYRVWIQTETGMWHDNNLLGYLYIKKKLLSYLKQHSRICQKCVFNS